MPPMAIDLNQYPMWSNGSGAAVGMGSVGTASPSHEQQGSTVHAHQMHAPPPQMWDTIHHMQAVPHGSMPPPMMRMPHGRPVEAIPIMPGGFGHGFVLKRCQGFVRADLDIDAEVVGWVIGKNGSTIRDLKQKTGCNMWVDQRALKLTITGPDILSVKHAAKSVQAYVAAAPIKAGAVEEAVTENLDCPPHLLDTLADRTTIGRIVKETRAQVVVNKKMMMIIVRGNPHAVSCSVSCSVSCCCSGLSHQLWLVNSNKINRLTTPDSGLLCLCYQVVAAVNKVHAMMAAAAAEYGHKHSSDMRIREERRHSLDGLGLSETDSDVEVDSVASFASLRECHPSFRNIESPVGSAHVSPKLDGMKPPTSSCLANTWSLFSSPFSGGLEEPGSTSGMSTPPALATPPPVPLCSVEENDAKAAETLEQLLGKLSLAKYVDKFVDNEVDMAALSLMEEGDLADIGIPKGPRVKILHSVKRPGAPLKPETAPAPVVPVAAVAATPEADSEQPEPEETCEAEAEAEASVAPVAAEAVTAPIADLAVTAEPTKCPPLPAPTD
ncbi:unnamed protein product [Chrysoparadoxa australica]